MLQFFLTNILFISAGAVLYLVVRALPRVEEEPKAHKQTIVQKWLASGVPERFDTAFEAFSEKFLRKTKVLLLKADNIITARLKQIKSTEHRANTAIKFEEMKSENGKSVANTQESSNI